MSEQEQVLETEQLDPQTEAPTDWEERLNAATEEHVNAKLGRTEDEETAAAPEEEPEEDSASASTEPPDEEPAREIEPEPEQPSQTEDELEYARRVANVLRERPDLAEALVGIERGDFVPMPREVVDAIRGQQQPQQAQTQEQPQPESDFWEDPEAKFRELERRLAEQETYRQQIDQAARQREDSQNLSLIESVGEEFRSAHAELSEEQFFQGLIPTIAKTNLIRVYREQFPGDNKQAVKAAFEAAFRMNHPELAQRQNVDKQIREQRRARRAGATAASPRSVSRTQEEPKTRQERIAAMAADIDEAMKANA